MRKLLCQGIPNLPSLQFDFDGTLLAHGHKIFYKEDAQCLNDHMVEIADNKKTHQHLRDKTASNGVHHLVTIVRDQTSGLLPAR
eukprot:Stramenopile-MAST_4_protein_696